MDWLDLIAVVYPHARSETAREGARKSLSKTLQIMRLSLPPGSLAFIDPKSRTERQRLRLTAPTEPGTLEP